MSATAREATPIAELGARAASSEGHARAVRAMFDRIAPTYDTLNRALSLGLDARWRRRAVAAIDGAPQGEVLDLCAGTLDLAALIERTYPRRGVVAVDFAADMLARGAHKVKRTERVVADALRLPFETGRFAAVICGFGLRNLGEPGKGLDEAVRVLAPGGHLVVLEFFRPEAGVAGAIVRAFHAVYARAVLPAAGAAIARDGAAYAYLARSMASFLSRRELEAMMAERGLLAVHGEDLALGVASIVSAHRPERSAR